MWTNVLEAQILAIRSAPTLLDHTTAAVTEAID